MIFKSFFSNTNKTKDNNKSEQNKSQSASTELFEILNSEELLDNFAIKELIKDIKHQVAIPEENYQDIYLRLTNNYAEFVQSLPNLTLNTFNTTKGQILLGLIRASISLEHANLYECPLSDNKPSDYNNNYKREAIWQFAIFSSALLLDLAKELLKFEINTCTEQQKNIKSWGLINGPMTTLNNDNTHYFYKVIQAKNTDDKNIKFKKYTNKLNFFIIKQLIPEHILAWLYSEQDIFIEWLALFDDESTGSGTLYDLNIKTIRILLNEYQGIHFPENILELLPHHLKQKYQYHKTSFWKGVEYSLKDKYDQHGYNIENKNQAGKDFLKWLKDGIEKKDISVNQKNSLVHKSKDGLFLISPEIFTEFCKKSQTYNNWLTVFKSFNNLGLSKITDNTAVFQQNFIKGTYNQKIKTGIIIQNAESIFQSKDAPLSTMIAQDPAQTIQNSTIFPTPQEQSGNILKRITNPRSEL